MCGSPAGRPKLCDDPSSLDPDKTPTINWASAHFSSELPPSLARGKCDPIPIDPSTIPLGPVSATLIPTPFASGRS